MATSSEIGSRGRSTFIIWIWHNLGYVSGTAKLTYVSGTAKLTNSLGCLLMAVVEKSASIFQRYFQSNNILCSNFAALIESDAEGIGGSGFVECIREHINSVCIAVRSIQWLTVSLH